MSRLQSSSSHQSLGYKPALTVLLRHQLESSTSAPRSRHSKKSGHRFNEIESPQQSQSQSQSGAGASVRQQLERKSAKGLLKSLSTSALPSNPRLAPLQANNRLGGGASIALNPQAALSNPADSQQQQSGADIWRAEQSKPTSSQAYSRPKSGSALVPALPGESAESRAYRSLPKHSFTHSHYYQPQEAKVKALLHVHQYTDGTVVDECTCERGAQMVEAERAANPSANFPQRRVRDEEEKDSRQPPQTPAQPFNRSPVKMLSPSQLARAELSYAKHPRQADTSRLHSVYAAQYKPLPLEKFHKLGKDYFASNNKSYVRACLQDPGYGFQLDDLKARPQNDPDLPNYAAEISREHKDPAKGLRSIIAPVNWPDTTHHADFAPPSAELIKSYKRIGRDYRQAGNRSYMSDETRDKQHPSTGQIIRLSLS